MAAEEAARGAVESGTGEAAAAQNAGNSRPRPAALIYVPSVARGCPGARRGGGKPGRAQRRRNRGLSSVRAGGYRKYLGGEQRHKFGGGVGSPKGEGGSPPEMRKYWPFCALSVIHKRSCDARDPLGSAPALASGQAWVPPPPPLGRRSGGTAPRAALHKVGRLAEQSTFHRGPCYGSSDAGPPLPPSRAVQRRVAALAPRVPSRVHAPPVSCWRPAPARMLSLAQTHASAQQGWHAHARPSTA